MAKVKLTKFRILCALSQSKALFDYIQRLGVTEIDKSLEEGLEFLDTNEKALLAGMKKQDTEKAFEIIEKYFVKKKGFLASLSDTKEIDYSEYKLISDKSNALFEKAEKIISLEEEIAQRESDILSTKLYIESLLNWQELDIRIGSRRTLKSSIFIGSFKGKKSEKEILDSILSLDEELSDTAVEVVHSDKFTTNAVVICHCSHGERLGKALSVLGFSKPKSSASKTPAEEKTAKEADIKLFEEEIDEIKSQIQEYAEYYDDLLLLYDYFDSVEERYTAMERAQKTNSVAVISGYIPVRDAEEFKFEAERLFLCEVELLPTDEMDETAPTLIENNSFASGTESITNMYSPPSVRDVDPNPVMSFFYYAFFGLMLSDAGYGILMAVVCGLLKFKYKVKGSFEKTCNMFFYCGISATIWGVLFGSFFGDAASVIAREFFGKENFPSLALWMEPLNNTMELLMYCLLFGIIHLFAGLLIRFYMLIREKNYLGAVFDVIPVIIFVCGFAIFGGDFIFGFPEAVKPYGKWLLIIGSAAIILTSGRNAKNLLGKLGGGLYALYNAASGYLGDILSYSRLLALGLVTGVIASVVNLLASMTGNIITFIIVFIFGHSVNILINLIGTYVHTNRLQYVEFFSKFYEGSGRLFTPFKIKSKFFTIKED